MKPAYPSTVSANAGMASELDFSDQRDFEEARRGFVVEP